MLRYRTGHGPARSPRLPRIVRGARRKPRSRLSRTPTTPKAVARASRRHSIGRSGYFGRPEERRYRFGVTYEAGSYLRLLGTHSSHRALEGRTRQRLFAAVARPIDEGHGGRRVVEGYRSELYVARRL